MVGENVRKKSASQYSPSVSHDEEEEEQEIEVEEEDTWEAIETVTSSKLTPNLRDDTAGRSDWRETEQHTVASTESTPFMISSPSSSSKAMKLLKPGSGTTQKPQIQSTTSKVPVSPSNSQENTALLKIRDNLKGRMCEEDIVRLETQLLWSQETDIFADIEPEIPTTSRISPPTQNTSTFKPILSLQPQQEVEVSGSATCDD